MAIRQIIEIPDPLLKQVSAPVTAFDAELETLVADMFETMYDAPGIGLAAIQVGVPLRVLVIDLQPEDPDAEPEACDHDGHHHHQPTKREPQVFINPVLSDPSDDQSIYSEGCLSVPEIYADVERPARVRVQWQDLEGKQHDAVMDGIMATCIQHEIDHLEGIVFIGHLSRLKRQMALKKLEKLRKAA